MPGEFGFWEALTLAASVQGAFLAAVIWTHRRGHKLANRLLASLLLLYSFQLLEIVLYWTRTLQAVPHLWGMSWMFPYLYGVLLYFYAAALSDGGCRISPRTVLHLTPFLLGTLLFVPFYLQDAEIKRRMLEASYPGSQDGGSISLFILAIWLLQFVHFSIYLGLTLRKLGESTRSALSAGGSRGRDGSRYTWLRRLAAAFGLSFACWFFNGLAVAFGFPYLKLIDYASSLAMSATIYAIGYTALRQPELFLQSAQSARGEKYQGSTLTPDQASDFRRRLLGVMQAGKPYRDSQLRLKDLAGKLDVPPHHLSQIINQHFQRNFNDFVNAYRVEEAKRLMADPRHQSDTLLDLAFEAGFNNKTSFNQAFKKHTGTTPSRFRAQLRN
ncbi:MAG TPA: helix-turn-helix domain-containing protein [Acidobacteriota bacterium]|nr:helix-turn-helix domain-containing protein [Acidobacteriota bacterium]